MSSKILTTLAMLIVAAMLTMPQVAADVGAYHTLGDVDVLSDGPCYQSTCDITVYDDPTESLPEGTDLKWQVFGNVTDERESGETAELTLEINATVWPNEGPIVFWGNSFEKYSVLAGSGTNEINVALSWFNAGPAGTYTVYWGINVTLTSKLHPINVWCSDHEEGSYTVTVT